MIRRSKPGRPLGWPTLAAVGLATSLAAACTGSDGSETGTGQLQSSAETAVSSSAPSSSSTTTEPRANSSSTTASTPPTTVDPLLLQAQNRPFMAMSVPRSRYETITAVEADVGQRIDLIRWFQRWDDDLQYPDMQRAIAEGRRVHLSVRPAGSAGLLVPWRDLADAEPGTETYDDLVAWVDRMVSVLPAGSYVTINHEPETRDSEANGNAEDFKAMWRRWNELLDERGGAELQTVWVMTGGAFSGPVAEEWYPGDDAVDIVGVDPYNWYRCQGSDRPWAEFEEIVAPALAFAESKSKPLAVAETASVEDLEQPGRKAEWIRNAADYLSDPDVAAKFEYVSWFNVTAPGGTWPDCVWDYDTSPESAEAFAELVRTLGDG